MEVNSSFSLLISIPIQCMAILVINFYWLDYIVSKRDFLTASLLILLPSIVLFIIFDFLAVFYLLGSLLIFLHKKYTDKIYVLHVLFSFIFAVVTDHLASLISLRWMSWVQSEPVFIILRNVLFCAMLAFVAYLYKRILLSLLDKYIVSKKSLLLLISLIFLTLVFFYYNITTMTNKSSFDNIEANLWIFNIYLTLFALIAIAIIYISLQQYKVRQKEKEQENFTEYVQLLEEGNVTMQKFKHDYINILLSLRYYIDTRDIDGLTTYFYGNILPAHEREIQNDRMLISLHRLKVIGLKGLLTTKIEQAQQQNIQVHVEITEEVSSIPMDVIELNRMMGILLDNAIEGSLDVEAPVIRIAFIVLESSLVIIVQNKINEDSKLKIHEVFQKGYSTKGENRGLGLSILKKIVNANAHIMLNTKVEPASFIQELEITN